MYGPGRLQAVTVVHEQKRKRHSVLGMPQHMAMLSSGVSSVVRRRSAWRSRDKDERAAET